MVFLHEDIGDVSVHNSFEWDGYYLASTYGIDATHNANLFFLKSWKDRVAGSIRAGAFEAAAYSAVKLWFDGRGNLRAGDNRAPLDALQGHSISLPMGEITVGWDAPYINHHLPSIDSTTEGNLKLSGKTALTEWQLCGPFINP